MSDILEKMVDKKKKENQNNRNQVKDSFLYQVRLKNRVGHVKVEAISGSKLLLRLENCDLAVFSVESSGKLEEVLKLSGIQYDEKNTKLGLERNRR